MSVLGDENLKEVRLWVEHVQQGPIWLADHEGACWPLRHDELNELPISAELLDEVKKWGQEFFDTYDPEYPPDGGFQNELEQL